jgi:hypothetical protein
MEGQSALGVGHMPNQALTCWTAILIGLCVVHEIILTESPVGGPDRGIGFGNYDGDAGFVARKDFFAFEITLLSSVECPKFVGE